jgi:hypothetical protein
MKDIVKDDESSQSGYVIFRSPYRSSSLFFILTPLNEKAENDASKLTRFLLPALFLYRSGNYWLAARNASILRQKWIAEVPDLRSVRSLL